MLVEAVGACDQEQIEHSPCTGGSSKGLMHLL